MINKDIKERWKIN